MAASRTPDEDRRAAASALRLRLLDAFLVLLCVMIVVMVVMMITGHGSRHEAGPIAALSASLAAVSASRSQLARSAPALDPAVRARRKRIVAIAFLVAGAGAIAGAVAVLVFHSR